MTDLDLGWIERELGDSTLGRPLTRFASTTSTNDEAKAALGQGETHGACFVAEVQTAGRGRRGRRWEAAPGEALLFSLLLDPPPVSDPSPLTLAVGLGVHEGLERHLAGELRIKWPNDLVCGRRKLAGILVESELGRAAARPLIVGVGINVATVQFPEALADLATSLALLGADVSRERLLVDVLRGIEAWYQRLCREGVNALVPRLSELDALRDQAIRVEGLEGRGAGFDAEGRLLLRASDGQLRAVVAGTVEWVDALPS